MRLFFQEVMMIANGLFKAHVVRMGLPALLTLLCPLLFTGCASRASDATDSCLDLSGTAYTYQPLNPTTVWIRDPVMEEISDGYMDADETSYEFNKALLRDLDTETVRIALDTLSGSVDLNAGVVGTSVKGQSYVLVVDYIKYFASSKPIDVEYVPLSACKQETRRFQGTVPMYTGIGLRIKAEFVAHKGELNISGLPALAVAASANGVSGRLTVQTLGITGPEVTALVPLISDVSVTSIQNAVQAVGAIKAKIYEESTTVYPKIIGFESPGRDPRLIRAITEALYASEEWICPTVIKNPQDGTKSIVWIDWFSPPPEDNDEDEGQSVDPQN